MHKNKTHESMDQDIKPRNKSTYLWSINLKERRQEYTMETRHYSLSGTGKTGQLRVKEKLEHPDTFYKNKVKID